MAGHLYTSFKGQQEKFDAIVIGSGIGGLSVAAILSKAGKKVLLLEKHFTIGGYTHFFRRKGYAWDVGLHYVGQVHIDGTPLNKVFKYVTDNKLKWAPLDDIYDRAVFGDAEYEFPRGKENLKAKFKEYFPAQKDCASIDQYFDLLEEVQQVGISYYVEKIIPPFLAKIFGSFLRRNVLKYSDLTTLEVLSKLTDNEKLLGVLTAQYGDYGLPPSQSSFYMHALLANHYMDGAGYPVGGAGRIAETVEPVIERAGGTILCMAEVQKIIVQHNTAIGVEMSDGKSIYAKTIISDAGVINTYTTLLPDEVIQQHGLKEKIKNLTSSMSHMGLYVGIKESPESLKLPRCNYWIFPPKYNHELNQQRYADIDSELPVAYVSFPGAKDPESQISHPGRATAEVIILVPYEWFSKWENTTWKNRGDEYEQLKKKVAEQMLEQLYRVAPQLKGKVEYYDISSPLTTKKFTNHQKGEMYGVAHTPARFRQEFLKPYTPVKNLFMTGQDVMIASIAGGLMGGVLCASAILKRHVFWQITRHNT